MIKEQEQEQEDDESLLNKEYLNKLNSLAELNSRPNFVKTITQYSRNNKKIKLTTKQSQGENNVD